MKGDADTYENILRTKVFPGLEKIDGYFGGYVMRTDKDD